MVRPGYKRTEVGEIPEEWAVADLQSACGETITYGIVQCGPHIPDGVPYVRVSDMNDRHLDASKMLRTTGAIAGQFKRSTVREGDLVYALRGVLGEVRTVPRSLDGANLTQGTARLSPSRDMHGGFLCWAMRSPALLSQAEAEAKGTTFREITLADLRMLLLPVPPIPEQAAIAGALGDADALIESLEHLLAKKRAIKQGAMQSLLTGAKRLPGFTTAWDTRRLDNLGDIVMGQSPSSQHYNVKGEGLPLIQGNADISNRKTLRRVFTSEVTKRGRLGDILMSVRAPVGEVSRTMFDVCLGRGVCAIRSPSPLLYYTLIALEPTWVKFASGTTFESVNGNAVKATLVLMPSDVREQAAIAEVLTDLDADLDATTAKLHKARAIKQGMMQELLTGRIRLV